MSLQSWLGLKPKFIAPGVPDEPKLGMRSPLVLAKIGYDLRQEYDNLLEQPLPEEFQQVVARLPGATVVLPFPTDPKAEI